MVLELIRLSLQSVNIRFPVLDKVFTLE